MILRETDRGARYGRADMPLMERTFFVVVKNDGDETIDTVVVLYSTTRVTNRVLPVLARSIGPGEERIIQLCPTKELRSYAGLCLRGDEILARIPLSVPRFAARQSDGRAVDRRWSTDVWSIKKGVCRESADR